MCARRVMTRSGGRTEANRQAVAQAALKLISEGRLLFDVQDIADISGVHRTTIRRRWPDRDALLAEAMAEHTSRLSVDLMGDWRRVLKRIAFGNGALSSTISPCRSSTRRSAARYAKTPTCG